MPKVHHVKKARRPLPNHGIEVGDSYYWWASRMKGMRSGRKFFSKTYPKQSQLTQSDYYKAVYELQESMTFSGLDRDDLIADRDSWAEQARQIGQEQRDKLENMPEGLQQGDTGQMLESRAEACDTWADEIEAIDIPEREDDDDDDSFREKLEAVLEEITSTEPSE